MPTIEAVSASRSFVITRAPRYTACGIVCALTTLLVLATLLALVAWQFWVSANGVLGTPSATLIVAGLMAGAGIFSRYTAVASLNHSSWSRSAALSPSLRRCTG